MEKIQFSDFQNCLRLSNAQAEIVISSDFGPRILAYNLIGGENMLGLHPQAKVDTALGEFRIYGGHRFWLAPEHMPSTYAPDNAPVEYFYDEKTNSVRLVQPLEPVSQTQKELTVTLAAEGSEATLRHRVTNCGERETELAIWGLTVMNGDGGEVFLPNETYRPYGPETLLPVRNLTVWSYTDFSDPRWRFEREFIRIKVDPERGDPQKIGVLNKQGWAKYRRGRFEFTKKFVFDAAAAYPDMNSNTEIYVAGTFIEVESLAPLRRLKKGESTEHVEIWKLAEIAA